STTTTLMVTVGTATNSPNRQFTRFANYVTRGPCKGVVMNRRVFLSRTAAATAGLSLSFPARSLSQSPNETINVAIVGIRGDNENHPTWTARGRGQDHYDHLSGVANVRITHVVDVDERHFTGSLVHLKARF